MKMFKTNKNFIRLHIRVFMTTETNCRSNIFLNKSLPMVSLCLSFVPLVFFHSSVGARCNSVVVSAHGVISHGPTELFLIPHSVPRLVYQQSCHMLSCLWDGAYKRISFKFVKRF